MTAPRAIHQLVIEMPAIDVFRLNHSMTVLPVRPTQLAASFISNQAGGEPPPHARHRALTLSGPALLSKHDSTPPSVPNLNFAILQIHRGVIGSRCKRATDLEADDSGPLMDSADATICRTHFIRNAGPGAAAQTMLAAVSAGHPC